MSEGRTFQRIALFFKSRDVHTPGGGARLFDEPVVIHCYTTPEDIEDEGNLADLATFARRMGREAKQGEVGLIVADEYISIRNSKESFERGLYKSKVKQWLRDGVPLEAKKPAVSI